ncbi:hypothetical protein HYW94_02695 [Candidatus Uhrbacteria bacterium]|nr:hypothetical protein [Candidatus Uhrbacteria bacterium]
MDMDIQQPSAQPPVLKTNAIALIVVIVLILGVGAGLGYVFTKKGGKNVSQDTQVTAPTTPTPQVSEQPIAPPPSGTQIAQPAPPPPPPSIGFYGKVMKRDGTAVTIQQLLPPTTPGGKLTEGKTYTVTAEETISYINQKKNPKPKPGEPPFSPSPGSLSGLTKGLFVYIETGDDIATKTTVKANQVMYSIESPF